MNTLIRTIAMAVFGAAILAAMPARAADGYPAKQIHIVVPFPPPCVTIDVRSFFVNI